jgi:hypothetical protein
VDFTADELENNVTRMHSKLLNLLWMQSKYCILYLCSIIICNCKVSKVLNTYIFLPYLEHIRFESILASLEGVYHLSAPLNTPTVPLTMR